MTHNFAAKLMPIVDTVTGFFGYMQSHQLLLALFAGLTMPFLIPLEKGEHEKAPFWQRVLICLSMLCLLFGTLSPITSYVLRFLYPTREEVNHLVLTWVALLSFTVAGLFFHIAARRIITPEFDKMKRKMVKTTSLERNTRTDIRNVKELLPHTYEYNPWDYIDIKKGIFVGLDKDLQPQYIALSDWQKQHAAIIGTTGAGKGVALALLLAQSILAGEGVFFMDPKNDEWAPHIFRKICEDAGKPFVLIDLNSKEYQLNLIKNITDEQLEELLIAGFSLGESGSGGVDFYRIDDRRAARAASKLINDNPTSTIRELFNSEYVQSIAETIKGFFGKIEELALLNSINAPTGFDLKEIFDNGGCCYVIGSLRNSKVLKAQKMIFMRLLQIAETRDRINEKPRTMAIVLDELKYHLSRSALEGLGTARDKGVHILMALQSIDDMKDCSADLNAEAIMGAVVENSKFKLVYRLQSPDTAKWVAEMSGTILVDDESRKAKTNGTLVEVIDDERMIRQAERFYVDSNMLLSLPDFVSYIFTTKSLPQAALISKLKVEKQPLEVYCVNPASPVEIKKPLDFTDVPAAASSPISDESPETKSVIPATPEPAGAFDFKE